MKHSFLFALLALLLSSCHSTPAKKIVPPPSITQLPKADSNQFFDYDALERYVFNGDEDEIFDLNNKKHHSVMESFKLDVLMGARPDSVPGLGFIDSLVKTGFVRSMIDPSKFPEINKIFTYKPSTEHEFTECLFLYANILVFKKNNKIVGVAKICFHCMENLIRGTKLNTENFGQNGDYARLKKILDR